MPWIPGALTPTEIEAAWRAGAAIVKLFPGRLGGPQYVRDVLARAADVPLMVTGGVDATNAGAFLERGRGRGRGRRQPGACRLRRG